MTVTGEGTFHDGQTPDAHAVTFRLEAETLSILTADGTVLAGWRLADIRKVPAAPGEIRLAQGAGDARLGVTDVGAAMALADALGRRHDRGWREWRGHAKVVGLTVAAVTSLGAFLWFGVPLIAGAVVPLIPVETEVAFGRSINDQVLASLAGTAPRACTTPAGVAALRGLVATLNAAAQTGFPLEAAVVDIGIPNAIALPGGRVVVFRGLIDRLQDGDELAAVLGHELGHVAHRDGMKGLVQAAGLSIVLSVFTGDFTGTGVTVLVTQHLVRTSYTRGAEADADRFGADVMAKLGVNPGRLADALERIEKDEAGPGIPAWLSTHPATDERKAFLRGRGSGGTRQLVSDADWAAIKAICR